MNTFCFKSSVKAFTYTCFYIIILWIYPTFFSFRLFYVTHTKWLCCTVTVLNNVSNPECYWYVRCPIMDLRICSKYTTIGTSSSLLWFLNLSILFGFVCTFIYLSEVSQIWFQLTFFSKELKISLDKSIRNGIL